MKETFPTSVPGGARLTTGWVNGIGQMLNRLGQSRPGSSMTGFRSGSFDADLPEKQIVIRPVEVTRFVNADTHEPEAINFKPGILIPPEHQQCQCKLLLESIPDTESGYADDDASYPITTLWQKQQFLLPAYTRYDAGTSLVIPGDRVMACWDQLSGQFAAVAPPAVRFGKYLQETPQFQALPPLESGQIAVYFHEKMLDDDSAGITVIAVNLTGRTIKAGTSVVIEYLQPMRRWFITSLKGLTHNVHIHFTLTAALSASDATATVSVDHYYEGTDPTEEERFVVYNPLAGCTGTQYRFHGTAGCKGQAIYSENADAYYIWQLDCPPTT